jgi:hypothetical protein
MYVLIYVCHDTSSSSVKTDGFNNRIVIAIVRSVSELRGEDRGVSAKKEGPPPYPFV